MGAKRNLVIRGGRVIDPANGVDGVRDIRISDGEIAEIAESLPSTGGDEIDAAGKLVVPGLIDFHTHTFYAMSHYGVDPDRAGIRAGVTHVNDMGSTGWMSFAGFRHLVAERAQTSCSAWLNIVGTGLFANWANGEINMVKAIFTHLVQTDLLTAVIENHRDMITGVKVHVDAGLVSIFDEGQKWQNFDATREVVDATNVGMYVHLGDLFQHREGGPQADVTKLAMEAVERMRPNDVLGHCFTHHAGGLVDNNGNLSPAAAEATARGIFHEVGHGINMSFDRARRFLDAGLKPDIISSDIHSTKVPSGRIRPDGTLEPDLEGAGLSWTMVGTMSKVWALGWDLPDVIRMGTETPAKALRIDSEKGTLGVGRRADVTILEIRPGEWELMDTVGELLPTDRVLLPWRTILAGEVFENQPMETVEFRNELGLGERVAFKPLAAGVGANGK